MDKVLEEIIGEAERMMCWPMYCEDNGDKGFFCKEIRRRGHYAKTYTEHQNKVIKISSYLRKWWPNIVFVRGTDQAYIDQILDYTEQRFAGDWIRITGSGGVTARRGWSRQVHVGV